MLSCLHGHWRLLATLVLAISLLSGTWPELEIHHHADAGSSMVATADHHHDQADTWGDRDGLHIHACACAAHCSAVPTTVATITTRSATVSSTNQTRNLTTGVSEPPFRPPIA